MRVPLSLIVPSPNDQAIKLDPRRLWRGGPCCADRRARLGDKQGAIADFRKALELKPGLPTAQESLRKLGAL
ncbi:hypothetical protein ABIB90_001827 [Bradyrhizobium sp. JR4.1]|uniref:tetratricopeptide repeat protein n=1 Tax=unclassified Bradyrhizobium TaxID=2631580 RepID=UPI00339A5B4D